MVFKEHILSLSKRKIKKGVHYLEQTICNIYLKHSNCQSKTVNGDYSIHQMGDDYKLLPPTNAK